MGFNPRQLGMWLTVLAYSLLSWQDATVKWLVTTVPLWHVLFVRSGVIVAACLLAGRSRLILHVASSPNLPLLLRRGLVTLVAWICYFSAARYLPLGQLTTLYFTAPIVVALLAAPLLGERVGPARWAAIGLGFLGAVLACEPLASEPGEMQFSWPTAAVLFSAVLWGYGAILTRQIARREPTLAQLFCTNLFFLVAAAVLLPFTWRAPSGVELLLLLQASVLGGLGQWALFEGARHVPASLAAPLEYSSLVWAFLLGFLVWGDAPSPAVMTAAMLILSAGVGLLLAERRRREPGGR
jgi:drug/metabolite transporter (DMT)-like permease